MKPYCFKQIWITYCLCLQRTSISPGDSRGSLTRDSPSDSKKLKKEESEGGGEGDRDDQDLVVDDADQAAKEGSNPGLDTNSIFFCFLFVKNL